MRRVKMFLDKQREKLIANHNAGIVAQNNDRRFDPEPVVKLFTPDAQATWLLTELDPDHNIAFGLCDMGMGFPEIGYVSIDEIESVRGRFGLPIERDRHFKANKTLSEYATESRNASRILA